MAEGALSVYNEYILKHYLSIKTLVFVSLAIGLASAITLMPAVSFAQSTLQNTTKSSLQPQTAPTQQSAGTQNQVGTLQNNNGSSVLNQSGSRPLGVVSSPGQTKPTTVVAPSTTTKAEIAKLNNNSHLPQILLAIGALVVAIIGTVILRRMPSAPSQADVSRGEIVPEKSVIKPEPLPVKSVKKSRKQQRRKKKKKSGQR